ncbi:hypothetical protein [Actinoallomurus iriomotensis]|uniref:SHOCT domain-containing protein n=1 Tax=Actinoallomurus iriomotensis TaxID=478107 RepID=A0A9W6RN85_9ACTN|nr:hypothetical protein [Actinoallomurus iriomotensis]GLY78763.1 hypothetical protein Airi01_070300 [Actinoallomurus iriomotensis]
MGIFRRKSDGVPAIAYVIAADRPVRYGGKAPLELRLAVQAPGREPFLADHREVVARARWPWSGTLLPVLVDADRPALAGIRWREVAGFDQSAVPEFQAMAERLTGGTNVPGDGGPRDSEPEDTVPPEYRRESRDTVTELERLAALHMVGSLTDAEFEAAKRRVLDLD